jgi:hypothetical protein
MTSLLLAWIIGIYTLYIRSHMAMLQHSISTVPGEHQAVFELASIMQAQLERDVPDTMEKSEVAVLTETQLSRRIAKDLKGGSMSFKQSLLGEGDAGSEVQAWRFGDWLRKEVWWVLALVVALGGFCYCAICLPVVLVAILLPFELVFVMYVGESGKSRCVMLVWPVLVSVVPTAVLVMMMGVGPR